MSGMVVVGLALVVLYGIMLIGIAIWSAKRDAASVAGGKTFFLGTGIGGIVLLFSMMASSFSTWVIMGCPVTTYNTGWQWIALVTLYQMTLTIIGGYLGPRMWVLRQEYGYMTVGNMFAHFFKNNAVRYILVVGTVLGLGATTVAQFKAMGQSISTMTGDMLPVWVCSLFLYFVILIYACIGGFKGVALVDTAQGILFTVILWGGLLIALFKAGGFATMFNNVAAIDGGKWILFTPVGAAEPVWNFSTAFSFCVVATVGGFFSAGFLLRYFASTDTHAIIKNTIWFPILVSIGVSTSGGLVGLSARYFINSGMIPADININSIFQETLSHLTTPWWQVIVVMGVLAAGLSTVAGNMTGAANNITYDFIHIIKPEIDDEGLKKYGRIVLAIVMFAVWFFSVKSAGAVTALVQLSTAFYMTALFPFATMFWWKRGTTAGTIAGMLGELIGTSLTTFVIQPPFGLTAGFFGLLLGLPLYIIVSLATKPMTQDERNAYFKPLIEGKSYEKTNVG